MTTEKAPQVDEATPEWQRISAAHRKQQQDNIPADWRLAESVLDALRGRGTPDEGRLLKLRAAQKAGLLTEKEIAITETDSAAELLGRIARGELTSLETTTAFCKRAAIAQQLTSCLTEIFFNEALERAAHLDKHLAEHGKVMGPLHGLPISLKDSFVVKGKYATSGYVEFLRRPPVDENSALVEMLLDAGAVLYCKTNIPQSLMMLESENNIYGRTLNPHKTSLTVGGSSGGEGALLAFRGAPLGVGTDLGGSIRVPALCCGIYGFKPTASRIPYGGQVYSPLPATQLPRLNAVLPSAGPMANSLEDLALFMRAIADRNPWRYDASAHHVPWRSVVADGGGGGGDSDGGDKGGKKQLLRIGLLAEDPAFPLHPPVRRALDEAAARLAAAGHTVVPFATNNSQDLGLEPAVRNAVASYMLGWPDKAAFVRAIGEPLVPALERMADVWWRGLREEAEAEGLDLPQQFTRLAEARTACAESWRRAWVAHGGSGGGDINVVLAPAAQSTAVPWDTFGVPGYTIIWNLLDYPACIIPYGVASKERDPQPVKAASLMNPDYDPDAVDGAPCAIQIVAPHFQDEECLRAARIIDECLRS